MSKKRSRDSKATTDGGGLLRLGTYLRRAEASASLRQMFLEGGREGEHFYRDRWSHDKVVRSTHGVNCTGSCSWKVYVKDGIISWEEQQSDYPSTGPDLPDYEPRGCPRGAAFSWYTYSPTRVRHPYIRRALLKLWRRALAAHPDPVEAWAAIVEDEAQSRRYKAQRGKGGLVRVSWEQAEELIAAAHVYTIKTYGPDRCAAFTVIPAMSTVSYGAGTRFYSLLGGTLLSFYDWYADLPMASPQVFGDQTDVPESGDWFNAGYLVLWGSNVPVTRTPDAHFMTEVRYKGTKVIAISPDYADSTKFADEWLPVHPGTDGALAMAMGQVILRSFHVERREPFFLAYLKKYTDAPFLVFLDEREGAYAPGKLVTAADLAQEPAYESLASQPNAAFKPVLIDAQGAMAAPNGSLGHRYGEADQGRWNLELGSLDPLLSLRDAPAAGDEAVEILLPRFDGVPARDDDDAAHVGAATLIRRGVPARRVAGRLVTTVYDLLLAQYGVERGGLPGAWPRGDDDASAPCTPAWAETLTGVPQASIRRVARQFAQNAIDTQGRSMVIMGAGINHYFHADTIYRAILGLVMMCGCQGRNGGGWAHYVGQEKVRPLAGFQQYAFALDWCRPPRHQTAAAFWYLATSQWRYDGLPVDALASPLASEQMRRRTTADTLVEASRRGWTPTFPTFLDNPLGLADAAAKAGETVPAHVTRRLNEGSLGWACQDPDDPRAFPRVITNWRTNLLGSSAKGAEYFHRHLLGCDNAVRAAESEPSRRPRTMVWRERAAEGKCDLLLTIDFRMTTTALHSDLLLPAATWYEKHDISTTDLHPFVHSFSPAIDPPWEARTDFRIFQRLAARVSELAEGHLGTRTDVVAAPLNHDTPDALATPHGAVVPLEQTELVPGRTMPKLIAVERDYTKIGEKFDVIGPLCEQLGMSVKGVVFSPQQELAELGRMNGRATQGVGQGRPLVDTDRKAAEMILRLSGTTNGRLATAGFEQLEKRTGTRLADLAAEQEGRRVTFQDTVQQPQPVITSPEWSGSETGGRRYSAFVVNIERDKPFHTLTGRMHFFLDHDWMRELGENLPVFRPPLDLHRLFGDAPLGSTTTAHQPDDGRLEVAVRYLTPHNKWSIHSEYQDNLYMLSLSRGGPALWMSPADAARIGVKDNDWVESYNRNGVVVARAVVSHRIPQGTVFMHHATERTIDVPRSEISGRRGGIHNALTRVLMKPTHLIGGYAQQAYAFNYCGPTGNQRDEVTVVRRRSQQVEY